MFDKMIALLLTTEWGRRSGWIAVVGMLLMLVYVFIETGLTWRSDFLLVHRPNLVAKKTFAVGDADPLIMQIPAQHLFGASDTADSAAILPVTSLQLRLLGVIKASSDQDSRVIISEESKPGKLYRIGDTLSSGIKISAIMEEGVVLDNDGHLEKLPLQRKPLVFQGMPKPLLENEQSQEE